MAAFQNFLYSSIIPQTLAWLWFLAPIWAPLISISLAWDLWVHYRRRAWLFEQKKVLLEIKLPQETFKTPAAAELLFTSLYQTFGETTAINRYWTGQVRPYFSVEIASIEGEIHFYIWTFKNGKQNIESNIYAQFPDAAVYEVDDYTKSVFFDHEVHSMFASEYTLAAPNPFPIKTYIDYGMDKAEVEEPYKVDPMAPLLESLGALKKGEQLWIQIIIRAHKKEKTIFNQDKEDLWKKQAKEEIEKIIKTTEVENADGKKVPNQLRLTKGQQEIIAALERSITKYAFDVGARTIYIADKECFNSANIGTVLGAFKTYNVAHLNGFKPTKVTSFDYPWQDFDDIRLNYRKHRIFRWYRERAFFYPPIVRTPFVLNTEELATIYHFPGSVIKTPTLKRIPSKRADAPANLPI